MTQMKIPVVRNILQANDRLAAANRKRFDDAGIFVINLMSSPGAGKTSLLEKTIDGLAGRIKMAVIEGDLQSDFDAERIQRRGVQAVQINTEGGCHLDGNMVQIALEALNLDSVELLIIENVGNLVCPAEFNLGEHEKVMILSVTEGDDKPLKYPLMFQLCSALLINKVDLLPYTDCNVQKIRQSAHQLNADQKIFELSCRTGEGLPEWLDWLEEKVRAFRKTQN
ncbi:MAG: hydrogenase nickel incorporation protein HypB [Desulforhabdus sp.]|jgi:hydrogenase nickel incorporation protein HypB|nr:hydrogenase nickel incorporation protein HypB [Desulforhabdus sp.]